MDSWSLQALEAALLDAFPELQKSQTKKTQQAASKLNANDSGEQTVSVSTANNPSQNSSSFLKLPGEMRNQIYEHYFAEFGTESIPLLRRKHITASRNGWSVFKIPKQSKLSLLQSCHQVETEAGSIFWPSVSVNLDALELVRDTFQENCKRKMAEAKLPGADLDMSVSPKAVLYSPHFRTEETALYNTLSSKLPHITHLSLNYDEMLSILHGEEDRQYLGPVASVAINVFGKLTGLTHITIKATRWFKIFHRFDGAAYLPGIPVNRSKSDFDDLVRCYPELQSITVTGENPTHRVLWTRESDVWRELTSGKDIEAWRHGVSEFELDVMVGFREDVRHRMRLRHAIAKR